MPGDRQPGIEPPYVLNREKATGETHQGEATDIESDSSKTPAAGNGGTVDRWNGGTGNGPVAATARSAAQPPRLHVARQAATKLARY
eukprot:COSAG01_NODE_315_length_19007_cov_18.180135_10_plen_87_part_00